jgi:Uma2 family endonuclease
VTRPCRADEKPAEYLAAGVAHYWIVDPIAQTIEFMVNDGPDGWRTEAILSADRPDATITVGDYGVVHVNHTDVFAW